MPSMIERFEIKGLHGYRNFDLHFEDNTMILVGENGSGKTSVLRMLYYLLSAQWGGLAQYKFQELTITISGTPYKLPYGLLEKNIAKIDEKILSRVPPSVRNRLMESIRLGRGHVTPELANLCDRYGIPTHYILREFDLFELSSKEQGKDLAKIVSTISNSMSSQILYLPTYRRIEQELNLILKDRDEEEWQHNRRVARPRDPSRPTPIRDTFVELIEFGMKDVDLAIANSLRLLREFEHENLNTLTLGYLGEVVEKEYLKVEPKEIKNTTEETIKSVLDRIHESILSRSHKDHLFQRINAVRKGGNLDEHAKVICHYFLKILHFQQELHKKEFQIRTFCDVCNQYMEDKQFVYNSAGFTLAIEVNAQRNKREIELRHLSSGEKQIVSLFSHVYLSGGADYFVLIDEPELSLSVPWQRRFLVDLRNGGYCSGLVAVTHSPFIYDNELRKYARGLGEFVL